MQEGGILHLMIRTLLALLLVLAPASLHAQVIPGVQPVTVTLSPQYPRPYETVTVKLTSTVVSLPASTITIYANGAIIGENSTTATFQAGAAGSRTTVRAVVSGTDGTNEASVSVVPADISLIIEPTATSHAFYEGGVLPAPEGQVRVVALTDFRSGGTSISPSNLIYTWKLGDRELVAESGAGRNVLTATGPTRYRNATVSVTVATRDRSVVGSASVVVAPVNPVVHIYRHDPLLGIDFAHALSGTFTLPGTEEAFRAVGYHFGAAPTLSWTLNGTDTGSDPDLTLRTTGTEEGTALLGVSADGDGIFSHAESSLTVQFGRTANGLFGF